MKFSHPPYFNHANQYYSSSTQFDCSCTANHCYSINTSPLALPLQMSSFLNLYDDSRWLLIDTLPKPSTGLCYYLANECDLSHLLLYVKAILICHITEQAQWWMNQQWTISTLQVMPPSLVALWQNRCSPFCTPSLSSQTSTSQSEPPQQLCCHLYSLKQECYLARLTIQIKDPNITWQYHNTMLSFCTICGGR